MSGDEMSGGVYVPEVLHEAHLRAKDALMSGHTYAHLHEAVRYEAEKYEEAGLEGAEAVQEELEASLQNVLDDFDHVSDDVFSAYWDMVEYARENWQEYDSWDQVYDDILTDPDTRDEALEDELPDQFIEFALDPSSYKQVKDRLEDEVDTLMEIHEQVVDEMSEYSCEGAGGGQCGGAHAEATGNDVTVNVYGEGGGPVEVLPGGNGVNGNGNGNGGNGNGNGDEPEIIADGGIQVKPQNPAAGHLFKPGSAPDSFLSSTSQEIDIQHDFHISRAYAEALRNAGSATAYIVPKGRNNYRSYGPGEDSPYKWPGYRDSDKEEFWFNRDAAEVEHLYGDEIEELMEEVDGGRVKLSGFAEKHMDEPGEYAVVIEAEHPTLGGFQVWDEVTVDDYTDLVLDRLYQPFAAEGEEPRLMGKEEFDDRWLRENDYVSDNFADMIGSVIGPEAGPWQTMASALDWFTGERHTYDDPDVEEAIRYTHALEGRTRLNLEDEERSRLQRFVDDMLADILAIRYFH